MKDLQQNVTVTAGQSETLTVGVQSHAPIECTLCKGSSQVDSCSRFNVRVTGTPPYLTVALQLSNVTKNDQGRWSLQMTNDGRHRTVYFNLDVPERARFIFSNVNDSVLSLEENTNVTLEFRLDKDHYPKKMFNNFTLKVAKFNDQSGTGATVCTILHLDGRCIQPNGQDCRCSQDSYSMNMTVSREDNGTWIWSVSDQKAVTKTITFNVKYNASITDLLLLNSSQPPADLIGVGTPAEIVCFWKNGNPPVKARLLDSQGTELNGTYSTGQIWYTFPAVSCQDAGLIRCEAPGASHNQTAVLLVKSPPEMKIKTPEIEFVPGDDVKIEINVCTHTNDLLSCRLTMLPDSEKSRTCVFGNDSSLTGTPPDLSLTITLDNVMKEEKGVWRLELTNDAGTDHADFHLATKAHYNASVKALSLLNSTHQPADLFNENASVEVECLWENGNPPVRARLLDRQGVEIESSSNGDSQIRYTFPAVGCQDAGLIRCEAPGASHNETAALLVKCPPQMEMNNAEMNFNPDDDVYLEVNVRTHTKELLSCSLRMLSGIEKVRRCKFGNDSSLMGTPPDLSLTILLDNVKKEEEGLWRLELTNDAGTEHVDFHLKAGKESSSVVTALPLVTTFAILALAAVVMAAVVLAARRCSSLQKAKTRRRPLPQRPDRVLFQPPDNASVDPDNLHLYQEIDNDNDSRQRPAEELVPVLEPRGTADDTPTNTSQPVAGAFEIPRNADKFRITFQVLMEPVVSGRPSPSEPAGNRQVFPETAGRPVSSAAEVASGSVGVLYRDARSARVLPNDYLHPAT